MDSQTSAQTSVGNIIISGCGHNV